MGVAKIAFVGLAGLIGFAVFVGSRGDSGRQAEATAALQSGDWNAYASARLPGDDGAATLAGHNLTLTFHETALTNGTFITGFNVHIAQLVPEIFSKAPDVDEVTFVERTDFVDLRGNRSAGDAMRATFSRANAAQVNWGHVLYDNLPGIADAYWRHPGFDK